MDKETFKAYGIGKGMLGLVAVARVTFIVDKKGVVRQVWVYTAVNGFRVLNFFNILSMDDRDGLDATMNFGAHSKFVEKWLDKLDAEDNVATAVAAVESPAAS